jgi:predicted amidohydrolase YtcJ
VERASLAAVGGVVWPPRQRTTAVAVLNDRIIALGSDEDVHSLCDRHTRIVHARGGSILPAFNDAHVHFLMGSRGIGQLDLSSAETQAEIERQVKRYAASNRDAWVIGRGWYYSAFPGGLPTIELLDRLVPDRPAYIESFDTHTTWVNSHALRSAGISPGETPGVLKESAMDDFLRRHLPAPDEHQDLEALRTGMRVAAEHGVASIQEASRGQDQLDLYGALLERDELTIRVRLAFDMEPGLDAATWKQRLDEYAELAHPTRNNPWIATGILKAFADGVVESRTAALLEPYEGSSSRGEPLWAPGELAEAVKAADARGWQVQVHAIGDAAIRQSLDAFTAATPERRHRIEHIEAPSPLDISRFAELGVIASMQPQHAEPNRNLFDVWLPNLGTERAAYGWPWRSILHSGAHIAFGTDWPVVPLDPAASLHVAVTRQTRAGQPAGGWLPDQRLKVAEALAAWTFGGAYAEHAEDQKGTLATGMLADIAVLDRDISATAGPELRDLKVTATIVGGRVVYEG